MQKSLRVLAPLAAAAVPLALAAGPAMAALGDVVPGDAQPAQPPTGSGMLMLTLNGEHRDHQRELVGAGVDLQRRALPARAAHPHRRRGRLPHHGRRQERRRRRQHDRGRPRRTAGSARRCRPRATPRPPPARTSRSRPSGPSTSYHRRTITLRPRRSCRRSGRHRGDRRPRARPGDPEQEGPGREERPRAEPAARGDLAGPVRRGPRDARRRRGHRHRFDRRSSRTPRCCGLAGGLFVLGAGTALFTVRRKTVKA